LLGFDIHALRGDEVLAAVDGAVQQRSRLLIGVVNAAKLVNMRRDAVLRESVLRADMILADGMSVVYAARLLGRRLPERLAGIDLMQRMLDRSRVRGYRVFCLGARQEVLAKAVERMRADHPGLVIVGQHHGYFRRQDEPVIAEQIRASRADILFVAITSPKKEQFLARWSARMEVPVCHGVGGAFDVLAGVVRRAPVLWQRLGLEWLYRVVQEPRRMWRRYLTTNTVFCLLVGRELLGWGRASRT
jgi:N-acetylglucosaminyldiphosphoundecaprenol N-acetyl-beta-D-mannosaminyltransferase